MAEPKQQITADPWEEAARNFKPDPNAVPASTPSGGNDDWKIWQQNDSAPSNVAAEPLSVGGVARAMGDQAGRALSTAASDLNPIPAINMAIHPIDTASKMFGATSNAIGRTRKALGEGQFGEAAKSSLGAVPVIGPALENMGRDVSEGRIPEAVGHAGAFYLGNKAPGALGRVMRKPAPGLAEKAMGITANDRAWGTKPGEAILEHTTATEPAEVAQQAQNRINAASRELETAVTAPGADVPLTPARTNVANAVGQTRGRGAVTTANEMEPMGRFLHEPTPGMNVRTIQPPTPMVAKPTGILGPTGTMTTRMGPGATPPAVIDPMQPASDFLGMRRGFNTEFGSGSTWAANPRGSAPSGLARSTYHELTDALHQARPETVVPDTDIHNLAPVVRSAKAMGRREGLPARLMTRIERPTGALAAPILGYSVGGAPGAALAGGVQEMLSDPSWRLRSARALDSSGKALQRPNVGRVGRLLPLTQTNQ